MTHNLHILLGNCAEQNISNIKKYAIKYGKEYVDKDGRSADDYLQLLLFDDNCQFHVAQQKAIDKTTFVAGIDDHFAVELIPVGEPMAGDDAARRLTYFFSQRFTNTVNMNNRGDGNLHVCIHVPLYSEVAWTNAEAIMAAIEATEANYTVDLLLLAADLAFLTIEDESLLVQKSEELDELAKNNLRQIVEVKTKMKYRVLNSLILVQNHNEQGIALDLNHESYANLVGEYALSVSIDYNRIFSTSFLLATKSERPLLGLGLSMLNFDRYYFVQYLLRKAYNYILDREVVTQEEVDVNKVSNIVQSILVSNINIFSRLYDEEVVPLLNKMSHEDIMAAVEPCLRQEIERLEGVCTSFVNDTELTLPEKRATLAQLLGEDDPLLHGVQYNAQQIIIDECRTEVMDLFVNANNALAVIAEEEVDRYGKPIRDYAVLSPNAGEVIPTAQVRIDNIKKLKHEIKTGTDYIRRQEQLLTELENNIQVEQDSHKRLTPEGFLFEDQVYRLNPENIERPLEETYVPTTGSLPSDIDLRQDFSAVRDQGTLGSCTAFALVAAYEYIVKRSKNKEIDLSELFAYQCARRRMPEEQRNADEGTAIYDVETAMGEDGICLESLHPYVTESLPEPSAEAVEDAQGRKITKALNVECKLNDLKSALSQGYPVVISLRLFESFAQSSTGFVPHPSKDERSHQQHGNHAMVICGYSDAEKVFIVRNSWGTRFGDKGYCYIPYSYITDPELLNQACIITEISEAEISVVGKAPRVAVSFNKADAAVQAAIMRTLIEEERLHIETLKGSLSVLRTDYYMLEARLGLPATRDALRVGTEERLTWEINRLEQHKQEVSMGRSMCHDDYQSDSRSILIYLAVSAVVVVAIYVAATYFFNDIFQLSYWVTAIPMLGVMTLLAAPIFYHRTRLLTKQAGRFMPVDDVANKYNSNVVTVWIVWIVVMAVAFLISILRFGFFDIQTHFIDSPSGDMVREVATRCVDGEIVDAIMQSNEVSWYDRNIWIITVLSLLLYIPFLSLFICRYGILRALDEKYRKKLETLNRNIQSRSDARSVNKLRMHFAGLILDSITSLISRLRNKYYGMRMYVDNLAAWRHDNDAQMDMVPVNRQPFMSLINNACLDRYFENHADTLTKDVRLSELLCQNYDISDEQVVTFKYNIKESIAERLWSSVADFSIYDHVVGKCKYEYVDDSFVNVQSLISTMDVNSEIFVRTTMRMGDASANSVRSKMLFRSAPGNDGSRNWDSSVATYFSSMPMMYDLASENKIFIIRIEGLSTDEISMLK